DGKGVNDADLLRLSERGVRLDEQANGSGLGLSICRAVAESYDGELAFAASELGGLQVKVSLRAT
ncbi:ATP-binding protein, partial [Klebsiella pneumoniae]|uniref:ATP-binding protein n=1 Tax=Klebsiella pneumoniae TaxID=573 RepID=UPI0027709A22|nr:two-component system sensor histidine kinase PhoQ [Klebsiella pneumoniae]